MKYKYLEIRPRKNKHLVECRIDVSGDSPRSIDKIRQGMNINLEHTDYFVSYVESDIELPKV